MSKYLAEVIDSYGLTHEQILTPVDGELPEGATDNTTFCFGNRELIISPDKDGEPTEVWVLNDYGNGWTFEQYE